MYSACYFCTAILQLELQECTPRVTSAILQLEHSAYYSILQLEVRECSPRTTLVLQICDFQLELLVLIIPDFAARAAGARRGSNPRPRDSRKPQDNCPIRKQKRPKKN